MNQLRMVRWSVILLALLLLLTLSVSVIALQHPEEAVAARQNGDAPGVPLPAPPELRAGSEIQALAPRSLDVPSSAIVYQSYVGGNWEIMYASDQGSRRLTTNTVPDILPRLNRGATQVVFASNRDGDYELYVVNVDGSSLRQLTNNDSDDVGGTWSPDGKQIAFETYRNGNAEIYVMTADGSGQRRLTMNAAFDGMPDWSPNGQEIAFSSNRDGAYYIHAMRDDGSEVRRLSNQPYSFRPSWSPDGARIAFDADDNGDGWMELWLGNMEGTFQHMIYRPGVERDAWSGSWSPDGRYLGFSDIDWILFQGQWYLERAEILRHNLSADAQPIVGGEFNLYPHWETTDADAPHSKVHRLPRYMPADGFNVAWSGEDVGPVGLRDYDVQFHYLSGAQWTTLISATQTTSATLDVSGGATVQFRSRARDMHYNVEAWPARPDASTTFYEWAFAGQITDNRGAPLSGVELETDGGMLMPVVSVADGGFTGYSGAESPTMASVSAGGYGPLPAAMLEPGGRYRHPFALPPADNVLANSTFETMPGPGNWTVAGDLPVNWDESNAASGFASLVLGAPCPTPPCLGAPEDIPGVTDDYELVASAVEPAGAMHLLWRRYVESSAREEILHSARSADGSWTQPNLVTTIPLAQFGFSAKMVADDQGNLHAVWHDADGIKHVRRPAGGQWSAPRIIYNLQYDWADNMVAALINSSDGQLHLLYLEEFAAYHMARRPDGHWSAPQLLWTDLAYDIPLMATGPDGRLHTFAVIDNELLAYRWRSPEGIWSAVEVVPHEFESLPQSYQLLVGDDNTVHVLAQDYTLFHMRRVAAHDWTAWEATPVNGDSAVVVAGSRGKLHLIYKTPEDGSDKTYYRRYLSGAGWQAPVELTQPYFELSLHVDAHDKLHVIFEDSPNLPVYLTSAPAGAAGTASINQQVQIPSALDAPTLSFMARGEGDRPGDGTSLLATVDDGVTTTTVFSGTVSAAWHHEWADVSAWSGQTVTITLGLQQAASDPQLQVWLDDVTLGSAHPDIWVRLEGPADAAPGSQTMFTITYGNRGGVDAAGAGLTVTLPPELTFVSADMPPTSTAPLQWDLGLLTAGSEGQIEITVGVGDDSGMVDTTAQITATTAELRSADNSDELALFIGYRVLLPSAQRQ